MKKRYRYWVAAGLVAVVIAALMLVFQVLHMDVGALAVRYKNSWTAVPIVLSLYVLKAVTLFVLPQPFLYLLTGLLFSPLAAFLLTMGCLCMEFTMDYALGRRFGKRWIVLIGDKLRGHSRLLDRILDSGSLDTFQTLLMLRLLPGISTDAVSLLAGSREARFRRFFVASLLGASPKAIAVTLMGSTVQNPLSPGFLIPAGLLVTAVAVSWMVKHRADRRNEAETERKAATEADAATEAEGISSHL